MGNAEYMGVASRVQEAFKMHLLSLLPLLCIVSAAPEGGLFGFGLLGGDSSTNTTTTTTAPITTTTASPATTTALVEALTSTTVASSDDSGIIQNLVDVLTGKVATIALDQLSSLLGLNNPPALALAMGGLAGNLVLTHIFTIATEAVVSTTVAAAIQVALHHCHCGLLSKILI